jgi:hypothetical protein
MSAQPATDYYAWQVEVYLNNFILKGYDPHSIHVVGCCNLDKIPDSWKRLQGEFVSVNFFIYEDTTGGLEYGPAIQSHMLKKHWESNEWLKDCAVFFHDCDFLFTRYFDFTPFLKDDVWYLSDTIAYIGADYIKSKGEDVLNYMCQVAKIHRRTVEENQGRSGGAQKLIKGATSEYWDMVFNMSIDLYSEMKKVSHMKKPNDPFGIQIWTASMWAELWSAWKMGFTTEVPKEFDFCWATCPISRWDDMAFFHNAGVPNTESGMFFKGAYIHEYPYKAELDISKDRCSYNYYKAIKSVDSCLL